MRSWSKATAFSISFGVVQMCTWMLRRSNRAITWAWNSATDMGARASCSMAPSLVAMTRRWSMKSKSMLKVRVPSAMGEVVSPRDVTSSVTFHQ